MILFCGKDTECGGTTNIALGGWSMTVVMAVFVYTYNPLPYVFFDNIVFEMKK